MGDQLKSVCVYCGSSNTLHQRYKDVAAELGAELAAHQITLVFGGGRVGLMGITSEACLKAGGKAVGIMTEFLYEHEGAHTGVTELHVVKSMHERKQMMFERSDAFVILPGGFGTLDETFEILTWRQVGLHSKPILFLNAFGYWSGLIEGLVPHMIDEGFVRAADRDLFYEVSKVSDVLPMLQGCHYSNNHFVSKWG